MGLNHSPSIVTNGLTLYLDAGNPKSYPGSGTAWNDLSGQGKNFTWSASPSFVSAGALSYFNTKFIIIAIINITINIIKKIFILII